MKLPKVGECPICFETGPVVELSKKCWHEPACRKCLRRIMVTHAQKDVQNFPLNCFHPQCRKPVHSEQLQKHNLLCTKDEIKKHYELTVLAKKRKPNFGDALTVRCPHCDHPRVLRETFLNGNTEHCHGCNACHKTYSVSPFYATIRALENLKTDDGGCNAGWARCPSCHIVISKGGGCNHMFCVACNHEFDWDKAQRRPPLARPPNDEIYLWW